MSRTKLAVGLAVIAAVAAAAWFYPPSRMALLRVSGRSPYCPMANALQADEHEKALVRYHNQFVAGSKLVEKDPAGYHLMDTPRGRWWIPAGNDFVLPFNLAEQETEVYGSGVQAVKPGDVVLDCGANVGVWTRVALKRGAKLVVGFEPAPENIEVYRRNFKDEIAAGRVILVPKGVWNKDDVLVLKRDPKNSAADSFVMLSGAPDTVQAPLTTIDKEAAELKLPSVDYIKMDIEGAEENALIGARETLARFHPRLSIAAEHKVTDPVRLPAVIRQAWPNYSQACGPCLETPDHHVRPDVLYFW